jgi:hypothetical protein
MKVHKYIYILLLLNKYTYCSDQFNKFLNPNSYLCLQWYKQIIACKKENDSWLENRPRPQKIQTSNILSILKSSQLNIINKREIKVKTNLIFIDQNNKIYEKSSRNTIQQFMQKEEKKIKKKQEKIKKKQERNMLKTNIIQDLKKKFFCWYIPEN